jgi:tetratricopeptide (TPR) repeat protein
MDMKRLILRTCILSACLAFAAAAAPAQTTPRVDASIARGSAELKAGQANEAMRDAQQAIQLAPQDWRGYALAGGALMSLHHYAQAAARLGQAIRRAPEAKRAALEGLRRKSLQDAAGVAPATPAPANMNKPAPASATGAVTQAEVVFWESIKNSTSPADFQAYLAQYPNGAFATLATRKLDELGAKLKQQQAMENRLVGSIWFGKDDGYYRSNNVWTSAGRWKLETLVAFTSPSYCEVWEWEDKPKADALHEAWLADARSLPLQEFLAKYSLYAYPARVAKSGPEDQAVKKLFAASKTFMDTIQYTYKISGSASSQEPLFSMSTPPNPSCDNSQWKGQSVMDGQTIDITLQMPNTKHCWQGVDHFNLQRLVPAGAVGH